MNYLFTEKGITNDDTKIVNTMIKCSKELKILIVLLAKMGALEARKYLASDTYANVESAVQWLVNTNHAINHISGMAAVAVLRDNIPGGGKVVNPIALHTDTPSTPLLVELWTQVANYEEYADAS